MTLRHIFGQLHQLWQQPQLQRWLMPAFIFVVAFLPRAIEPVTRPHVWFQRSYNFAEAVKERDWANTYQQYHPGVTVMWLSSLGLELYQDLHGEIQRDQYFAHKPSRPGLLAEYTNAAVLPLAFAIALCIALTYPLLTLLTDWTIALVGGLLLALDPFHIAYSKVIHVDALLASLMIVGALCLLIYVRTQQQRYLLLGGIVTGFAFLSKTPSIFLILYAGLILSVHGLYHLWTQPAAKRGRSLAPILGRIIYALAVWFITAVIVFILFFPAMWVEPKVVLSAMWQSILLHASSPHKNLVFFAGRLWEDDPGIAFDIAIILWKTTALTLPLLITAVFLAFKRIRQSRTAILWAFIAYAFFFTLQMGLADKKQMAYIMPTFPALSLIAAYGLVWTTEILAQQSGKYRKQFFAGFLALAIGLQALLVLRHHPYYSAQHNVLLGGSAVAAQMLPIQDQGEGLDIAADFLNELPYAQDKVATAFRRNAYVFERYYNGRSIREIKPVAAYRVYDLNSMIRDFQEESDWQAAWQQDQSKEPLLTVELDGVSYVWVYGDQPTNPTGDGPIVEVNARVGEHIFLPRVQLNKQQLMAGDELVVMLEWQIDANIEADYTVFTHLLSSQGILVAQQDNVPLLNNRPTFTWGAAEVLRDVHIIHLPADLPPGGYELSAGMYDTGNLELIPALDEAGGRLPGDRIVISTIQIIAPE